MRWKTFFSHFGPFPQGQEKNQQLFDRLEHSQWLHLECVIPFLGGKGSEWGIMPAWNGRLLMMIGLWLQSLASGGGLYPSETNVVSRSSS